MPGFRVDGYGAVFGRLLGIDRCRELGPGKPVVEAIEALQALTPERAFAQAEIADRDMAELCCGAVWLLHDYLEESHRISQQIGTTSGSHWHGIMHRREPDYSNAKYWFRRVGEHPVFAPLNEAAQALARQSEAGETAKVLASQPSWDAFRFVDLCEQAEHSQTKLRPLCQAIQQREWELLFDYCFRRAIGEP
jgi:hypothetical protein